VTWHKISLVSLDRRKPHMEISIALAQYLSLIACTVVSMLILGAVPYSIGKFFGRKSERQELGELFARDRCQFDLVIAEIKLDGLRRGVTYSRRGTGSGSGGGY
jgi:hypothetical protein